MWRPEFEPWESCNRDSTIAPMVVIVVFDPQLLFPMAKAHNRGSSQVRSRPPIQWKQGTTLARAAVLRWQSVRTLACQ